MSSALLEPLKSPASFPEVLEILKNSDFMKIISNLFAAKPSILRDFIHQRNFQKISPDHYLAEITLST
jgi:hypothetical protein